MAGEKQITTVKKTITGNYPATPGQQGMLRQSLSAPFSGVDIEQILCALPDELNVAAFRRAWERVVDRHRIFRTGFRVAAVEPRQEVHRQVRLHLAQKDWRGLAERERKGRMASYLEAERRRGFELSVPPLMRLALLRVSEAEHVLAWTFHRLLLAGHALGMLITEVFDFYETTCQKRDLNLPAGAQVQRPADWKDTGANFPRNKCIHQLFETQVDRTPNAVALVYSKGEVSYRELDNQDNRVAIHLRSLDLEPDVPVGIRRSASLHKIVGLSAGPTRVSREQHRLIPLSN